MSTANDTFDCSSSMVMKAPAAPAGEKGCAAYVHEVTTPKEEPPPPRRAQNKSGLAQLEAVTTAPLASTTVACMRLSTAMP